MSAAGTIGLGLLIGIRHAADPDHVAAIGAMADESRGVRQAVATGALWGIGHSLTVLIAGSALVLLDIELPAMLVAGAELIVALLLIGLGVNALRRGRAAPKMGAASLGVRAAAVGVAHGLAGSAGTTLLAIAATDDRAVALVTLALFGLGTVLGMMIVSGLLSVPLRAAGRSGAMRVWLVRGAGMLSVAAGVLLLVNFTN